MLWNNTENNDIGFLFFIVCFVVVVTAHVIKHVIAQPRQSVVGVVGSDVVAAPAGVDSVDGVVAVDRHRRWDGAGGAWTSDAGADARAPGVTELRTRSSHDHDQRQPLDADDVLRVQPSPAHTPHTHLYTHLYTHTPARSVTRLER